MTYLNILKPCILSFMFETVAKKTQQMLTHLKYGMSAARNELSELSWRSGKTPALP
jgi:hypothetical protein